MDKLPVLESGSVLFGPQSQPPSSWQYPSAFERHTLLYDLLRLALCLLSDISSALLPYPCARPVVTQMSLSSQKGFRSFVQESPHDMWSHGWSGYSLGRVEHTSSSVWIPAEFCAACSNH